MNLIKAKPIRTYGKLGQKPIQELSILKSDETLDRQQSPPINVSKERNFLNETTLSTDQKQFSPPWSSSSKTLYSYFSKKRVDENDQISNSNLEDIVKQSKTASSPELKSREEVLDENQVILGNLSLSVAHTTMVDPNRLLVNHEEKKPSLRPLKQLYLDLGQKNFFFKSCSECGMTFNPSEALDVKLHKKIHKKSIQGIKLSTSRLTSCSQKSLSKLNEKSIDSIYQISYKDMDTTVSEQIHELLDLIDHELDSVPLTDHVLKKSLIFLCCINDYITGAMIIRSSPLNLENIRKPDPIYDEIKKLDHEGCLYISRMWTKQDYRRRGIATNLLDMARQQAIVGITIGKDHVIYSQLTEDGISFAKNYNGYTNNIPIMLEEQ